MGINLFLKNKDGTRTNEVYNLLNLFITELLVIVPLTVKLLIGPGKVPNIES